MAGEECIKIGCPKYIRLSRQDGCSGESIAGVGNAFLIACTRNATLTKNLRDEVVSTFEADCGPEDRYRQPPQLQNYTLSFETSMISPQVEAGLTGETVLTNGASNDGVAYLANQGCTTAAAKPLFLAEVFFIRRGSCGAGDAQWLRYIINGIEFDPSEIDAEGQIRFLRYTGQSQPLPASGLLTQGANATAGPFDDIPAGFVTSIGALDDQAAHAFQIVDPTVDPTAGMTLQTGTCFTYAVPVAA